MVMVKPNVDRYYGCGSSVRFVVSQDQKRINMKDCPYCLKPFSAKEQKITRWIKKIEGELIRLRVATDKTGPAFGMLRRLKKLITEKTFYVKSEEETLKQKAVKIIDKLKKKPFEPTKGLKTK